MDSGGMVLSEGRCVIDFGRKARGGWVGFGLLSNGKGGGGLVEEQRTKKFKYTANVGGPGKAHLGEKKRGSQARFRINREL